jgi:hypothetical protein
LAAKFEPFLTEPGAGNINRSAHVDYRVVGIVPLQIFLQTDDLRCRALGLSLADAEWSDTTSDGLTHETRYWIDDMYVIPAVQVQAYRATRDSTYLDADANLKEVCVGTNKGNSEEYYLERPRAVGDLHGQAPLLWTASALLR